MFTPLLSIAGAGAMHDRVMAMARMQSSNLRADRGVSLEAQLLDTMYCMRKEGLALQIRVIAERFDKKFGIEHERRITARWIGAQLRGRFSLVTVKSHGTYMIPSTEESKIARLFERYRTGHESTW